MATSDYPAGPDGLPLHPVEAGLPFHGDPTRRGCNEVLLGMVGEREGRADMTPEWIAWLYSHAETCEPCADEMCGSAWLESIFDRQLGLDSLPNH